ncbi:hypothetical protein [Vibrio alginolyticus]
MHANHMRSCSPVNNPHGLPFAFGVRTFGASLCTECITNGYAETENHDHARAGRLRHDQGAFRGSGLHDVRACLGVPDDGQPCSAKGSTGRQKGSGAQRRIEG